MWEGITLPSMFHNDVAAQIGRHLPVVGFGAEVHRGKSDMCNIDFEYPHEFVSMPLIR